MGVSALTLGSLMGGSALVGGLMDSGAASAQANARAAANEAQAANLRAQAQTMREQSEIQAGQTDKQKHMLRREYEAKQGRARNLFAAGNVDLSSASAMGVLEGSADAFATDVGENSYQRAIQQWEAENNIRSTHAQANALDAEAGAMKKQAGSFVPSLFKVASSAASSFLTGYSLAGGQIGSGKRKP